MSPTPEDTVFLAPASPPFAPHLGTIYTWCLLDAATRATRHLGGTAVFPESWNLSSRRLDEQLGQVDEHKRDDQYRSLVTEAVANARSIQTRFGIETDSEPAIRDDDPAIRSAITAAVLELVEEGKIKRIAAPELWCDPCGIALPSTATTQTCFRCRQALVLHERIDWFLTVDFPSVIAEAAKTRWQPPYALRRFHDLSDVNPLVRVGHFGRLVGITSTLDERQMLDPRLVAALYPRVLQAQGYRRIVAVCGQDIQRKWLSLVYATAGSTPALDAIINHGVLLADNRHKMSRYDGATPADLPATTDPVTYRAALLSVTPGRDIVSATIPVSDASRLRAKTLNTLRFLQKQPESTNPDAIDLRQELGPQLDGVDRDLASLDIHRAYAAMRSTVRVELSHRLIPLIRTSGCRHALSTINRLRSLSSVFFGGGV